MKDVNKSVGSWFKSERVRRDLTHANLAELLGITKSAISSFEVNGVSYKTAQKHAKTLGWAVPELKKILEGAPEPDAPTFKLTTDDPLNPIQHLAISKSWLSQHTSSQDIALHRVPNADMEPILKPNETVLVDISVKTVDQSGVYLVKIHNSEEFRQISLKTDQTLAISAPNNPNASETDVYPPILGKVIGVWGFRAV